MKPLFITTLRVLAVAAFSGFAATVAFAQSYYIDDFSIMKDGGTFFHETFSEGVLPPVAPSFMCGTPPCYSTNGIFVPADLAGGKLRLDPLGQGVLTTNAIGTSTLTLSATLKSSNSNDPLNTSGLKSGSTFSVTGIFDLVAPGTGQYGIRLTDSSSGAPGRDVLDLRVIDVGAGQMAIRYQVQDFVAGTLSKLQTVNIDPTGHDQIALVLSHVANIDAITASFQYLSVGVLLGAPTVLGTTANIFTDGNIWTRADFRATAPVPEPETYALMLAGLSVLGVVARRRQQVTA